MAHTLLLTCWVQVNPTPATAKPVFTGRWQWVYFDIVGGTDPSIYTAYKRFRLSIVETCGSDDGCTHLGQIRLYTPAGEKPFAAVTERFP